MKRFTIGVSLLALLVTSVFLAVFVMAEDTTIAADGDCDKVTYEIVDGAIVEIAGCPYTCSYCPTSTRACTALGQCC